MSASRIELSTLFSGIVCVLASLAVEWQIAELPSPPAMAHVLAAMAFALGVVLIARVFQLGRTAPWNSTAPAVDAAGQHGPGQHSNFWWSVLVGLRSLAEQIAACPHRIAKLLQNALAKLDHAGKALRGCYADILALVRLLRAWSSGQYSKVPWKVIIASIMALLYLVLPLDAIPDVLPFVGFTDDASVIAFVVASIKRYLDDFRSWEAVQDHDQ